MESGFHETIRVIVVDDDAACNRNIARKLSDLKFLATMCDQAKDALHLIQEEEQEFDVLITETKMPDMDCCLFVQQVHRLKPDIPIILMSEEGDTAMIKKGVSLGISDFFNKPITKKELLMRITLHHELGRKRKALQTPMPTPLSSFSFKEASSLATSQQERNQESGDAATVKKLRITWFKELHDKFAQAVKEIGLDKATPANILESMNVEGLTREQVSSHLQKYRLKQEKKNLEREKADGSSKTVVLPAGASTVKEEEQF